MYSVWGVYFVVDVNLREGRVHALLRICLRVNFSQCMDSSRLGRDAYEELVGIPTGFGMCAPCVHAGGEYIFSTL